jgi:hypothetical protein
VTARFYTNPFVKDAPMVGVVSATEPTYDGVTHTGEGSFQTWSRTIAYADGTTRTEEVERRDLRDMRSYFVEWKRR